MLNDISYCLVKLIYDKSFVKVDQYRGSKRHDKRPAFTMQYIIGVCVYIFAQVFERLHGLKLSLLTKPQLSLKYHRNSDCIGNSNQDSIFGSCWNFVKLSKEPSLLLSG